MLLNHIRGRKFAALVPAETQLFSRVLEDAQEMIAANQTATNSTGTDETQDFPFVTDSKCRIVSNATGGYYCKPNNIFVNCEPVLNNLGEFNGCQKNGLTHSGKVKASVIATAQFQAVVAVMILSCCCALIFSRRDR
jgi:hypothetical protein